MTTHPRRIGAALAATAIALTGLFGIAGQASAAPLPSGPTITGLLDSNLGPADQPPAPALDGSISTMLLIAHATNQWGLDPATSGGVAQPVVLHLAEPAGASIVSAELHIPNTDTVVVPVDSDGTVTATISALPAGTNASLVATAAVTGGPGTTVTGAGAVNGRALNPLRWTVSGPGAGGCTDLLCVEASGAGWVSPTPCRASIVTTRTTPTDGVVVDRWNSLWSVGAPGSCAVARQPGEPVGQSRDVLAAMVGENFQDLGGVTLYGIRADLPAGLYSVQRAYWGRDCAVHAGLITACTDEYVTGANDAQMWLTPTPPPTSTPPTVPTVPTTPPPTTPVPTVPTVPNVPPVPPVPSIPGGLGATSAGGNSVLAVGAVMLLVGLALAGGVAGSRHRASGGHR